MTIPSSASNRLADLSPFIYGTTRLGDESIAFAERVKTARAAMDAGLWFHTSHQYGDAFRVLRAAFDQNRAGVPKLIFKIGWSSISEIRDVIRMNLEPLGLERMDIGQLCLGGALQEEFRTGGACYEGFQQLKEEGLVGRFVLETWPWNSPVLLEALSKGFPDKVIDGYIFYFNPLQRFASNELFDLICERNQSIVAMRTVGGGPVHRQRDVPGDAPGAAPEYLQKRAAQVAPLFEQSGIESWTEFCLRFAHGVPQVRASVGSTSRVANLMEFLGAIPKANQGVESVIEPLPEKIQAALMELQRGWADDHDRHTPVWSM